MRGGNRVQDNNCNNFWVQKDASHHNKIHFGFVGHFQEEHISTRETVPKKTTRVKSGRSLKMTV